MSQMATVLIVDDSAVDLRLAQGLLEKRGDLTISHAADGQEALAMIGASAPDLVVTDLQMPEMNGLQLVRAIRETYPLIPVVLMTAYGSEEIAVEALQAGAASYVPKSRLSRDLLDTVENVLATAHAGRRNARLQECMTQADLAFELENDPSLVSALVDKLQKTIAQMCFCDETGRIRLAIALEEALLNSLYHGNLEISSEVREADARAFDALADERRHLAPYNQRTIHVKASICRSQATFVIRDQGRGFDVKSLPDPTDPSNLQKVSGRGMLLIRTFMDEVRHNSVGNEITMTMLAERRLHSAEACSASQERGA